ncbi:MAG: hypothetical protein KA314_13475 [Chloroflexi bacterium]|nr:hypothetical protein [Chloroflexota bacterium]
MTRYEPDPEAIILARVYRILLAAADRKKKAAAAQEAEAEQAEAKPHLVAVDVKERGEE